MKVKLGDITIRQMNILCSMNENCNACPLCSQVKGGLHFDCNPYASVKKDYDREIELPDEETEK